MRLAVLGFFGLLLAGCMSSSRMSSFAGDEEVQVERYTPQPASFKPQAAPSRWSVTCAQMGQRRVCSSLLSMGDNYAWLKMGVVSEASGTLTLGFAVPLEAKKSGALFVQNDTGLKDILKLHKCTPNNCNTVWPLTRTQKVQLLRGRSLEISYTLNSGAYKRFTVSLQELRGELTKLALQ